MADPSKKFIYVEMAFFARWWSEQDQKTRENVKMLVKEGAIILSIDRYNIILYRKLVCQRNSNPLR